VFRLLAAPLVGALAYLGGCDPGFVAMPTLPDGWHPPEAHCHYAPNIFLSGDFYTAHTSNNPLSVVPDWACEPSPNDPDYGV
jgi:hypothetical protein